jgi:hypothetical protein
MKCRKHFCFHFLGGIAIAAVWAAVFGAVVMLLWNCLIPTIFGLAVINFWQALGLLILARLLFGFGFGHGGKMAFAGRAAYCGHGFRKNRMREKWQNMSQEERENFINNRKEFFDKCCEESFERRNFFDGKNVKEETKNEE